MRTSSKRLAPLALALGGLLLSSLACDNWESAERKADREVLAAYARINSIRTTPSAAEQAAARELKDADNEYKAAKAENKNLAEKEQALVKAGDKLTTARKVATTQKLNTVAAEMTKVLGRTAASYDKKIMARSMLAMTEYETGDLYLGDLHAIEPKISQQLWEIGQTGQQIAVVSNQIKAVLLNDPKEMLAAVATKRGELTAAVDDAAKKIKELEGQIAAIQSKVNELTQQKDGLEKQVKDDKAKAADLSAKDASPLLDGIIENNRKAENLKHEIDKNNEGLPTLQTDLAAEQARKKNLEEQIAALDTEKGTLESNWKARQDEVEKLKQDAATLGQAMTAQVAEWMRLEKVADEARKQAVDLFSRSAKSYSLAAEDARRLQAEMIKWVQNEKFSRAPEAKAWKQTMDLYHRSHYLLRQGQALHVLATLSAEQMLMVEERLKLVQSMAKPLQDAGVTVPADVAANADPEPAKAQATKTYGEAITIFGTVYDSPVPNEFKNLKTTAAVSRMFARFGDYILTGKDEALKGARSDFQEAFGEQKDSAVAKSLPAELRG